MTPLACWIMATSGLSIISRAPSWRQSTGYVHKSVTSLIRNLGKTHHTSIAINQEDEFAKTNITSSQSTPFIGFNDLLHCNVIQFILFFNGYIILIIALDLSSGKQTRKFVFDPNGEIETVIHVTSPITESITTWLFMEWDIARTS
jgi:hypothetical protein